MTTNYCYDVFLSYRRRDPDKSFAHKLFKRLEADGYQVAIDERDFRANQSLVEEMERCVQESRFTVAIVSPRYLESGNTQAEARIRTVLEKSERLPCLIPFILEQVTLPIWMYDLTGIDGTDPYPLLTPYERLKQVLGSPNEVYCDRPNIVSPLSCLAPEAILRIGSVPPLRSRHEVSDTALPQSTSQLDILTALRKVEPTDLSQLIHAMSANHSIPDQAQPYEKIAALVAWAGREDRLPELSRMVDYFMSS